MMRKDVPWRALYCHTFTDEKYVNLSIWAKQAYLFIICGPHTTSVPGYYPVNSGMIAGQLGVESTAKVAGVVAELVEAGMIVTDGNVVVTPKFTRYHSPDNINVLKGWASTFDRMPKGPMFDLWLDALREWYDDHTRRSAEFRTVFCYKDLGNPPPNPKGNIKQGLPQSVPKQGEGEGEGEGRGTPTLSGIVPKKEKRAEISVSPVAPPLVPAVADQGHQMFQAWVSASEAQAQQLDTPPMVFTSLALRLLVEFQLFYNQNSKGARMTDGKIKLFTKRVRRLDPVNAMIGMTIFIDGYGGKKDWPYCAKIMTNQSTLSVKERDRDFARHQHRNKETGVWAEITQSLAERKEEEVQYDISSGRVSG